MYVLSECYRQKWKWPPRDSPVVQTIHRCTCLLSYSHICDGPIVNNKQSTTQHLIITSHHLTWNHKLFPRTFKYRNLKFQTDLKLINVQSREHLIITRCKTAYLPDAIWAQDYDPNVLIPIRVIFQVQVQYSIPLIYLKYEPTLEHLFIYSFSLL